MAQYRLNSSQNISELFLHPFVNDLVRVLVRVGHFPSAKAGGGAGSSRELLGMRSARVLLGAGAWPGPGAGGGGFGILRLSPAVASARLGNGETESEATEVPAWPHGVRGTGRLPCCLPFCFRFFGSFLRLLPAVPHGLSGTATAESRLQQAVREELEYA